MTKSSRKRYRLWLDFDKKCAYCGEDLPYELMTIDHMIPKWRGGARFRGNVVPACSRCNRAKADKDLYKGEMRWR